MNTFLRQTRNTPIRRLGVVEKVRKYLCLVPARKRHDARKRIQN